MNILSGYVLCPIIARDQSHTLDISGYRSDLRQYILYWTPSAGRSSFRTSTHSCILYLDAADFRPIRQPYHPARFMPGYMYSYILMYRCNILRYMYGCHLLGGTARAQNAT